MSEGRETQDWGDEPPKEASEISHEESQKPQIPKWVSTIPYDALAALFKKQPKETITESPAKTEETPTAPEASVIQTSTVPPLKTLK